MTLTVVLTRASAQYSEREGLAAQIRKLGVEVINLATVEAVPLPLSEYDRGSVLAFIEGVDGIKGPTATTTERWIVFLSPTSVDLFRQYLDGQMRLVAPANSIRIAVQGPGTAERVRSWLHRAPDLIPQSFIAENLAQELLSVLDPCASVLIPQSARGRDIVAPALQAGGLNVIAVDIYTTQSIPLSDLALKSLAATTPRELVFVFMSPSAVESTVAALSGSNVLGRDTRIVSVGPVTSDAVRLHGLRVTIEAEASSVEGVVGALNAIVK